MAHWKRERLVSKLRGRLPAPVVWDERNDVWDTGRRALLAYNPDASHHLVVQDDAVVPRGLVEACEKIIVNVPSDVPVSLYMGKARITPHKFSMMPVVDAVREQGASFAVFGGPWWGVGIILPTADIEAVVAYGDENPKRQPNYDLRIAQFYDSKGIDCYYTLPSIVDHRPGPSLIGRRGSNRHALWRHVGSLAELDWTGGSITPADMNLSQPFPVTP